MLSFLGVTSLWMTLNSVLAADNVSVQSQGLLVLLAGGMFTVVSLLINKGAESRADRRALAAEEKHRADRLTEKQIDRAAAIEKEERDYARQDKVANQAAEAARLLVETNKRAAIAAEQTAAEQSVIKQEIVQVKDLGIVTHALVNSDKTAGMKRQKISFIAQRAALVGQLRLAEQLAKSDSEIITPDVQASLDIIAEQVKVLDLEIATLDAEITARLAEQHRAEAAVSMTRDLRPVGPTPLPPPQADPVINIENATIEAGVVTVQPKPKP